MPDHSERSISRRSTIQAGTGLLLLDPKRVFGTEANSAIEIGLVGCGNRGVWIAGLFQEHTGARVVALHDVYPDRLEVGRTTLRSPSARLYKGYRGYEDLAASSLDAVVIEAPPYCRPEQAAVAVAAGKHVYMAKPVAVDVPGCNSIRTSGEKAQNRLSFFVDFQFRARPAYVECQARVRRGDLGEVVLGHVFYHTNSSPLRPTPGASAGEARLRNWFADKALSGDIIVEQNIHALDAACWLLDAQPLSAFGAGGRKLPRELGDCWDHFVVTYWFPNGVKVDFSSTQCIQGFKDVCARIYGTEGTADMHYYASAAITGKRPWQVPEKQDASLKGPVENIRLFVESIRSRKPINNAHDAVRSNLTAILGRTAAYEGRIVTWDEMLRRNERLDLRLPPV